MSWFGRCGPRKLTLVFNPLSTFGARGELSSMLLSIMVKNTGRRQLRLRLRAGSVSDGRTQIRRLRFRLVSAAGEDLSQGNPAVIGRDALLPIDEIAHRTESRHRLFEEILVLKTAAGQSNNSFAH